MLHFDQWKITVPMMNDLPPVSREAINWTNDGQDVWPNMVSLNIKELTLSSELHRPSLLFIFVKLAICLI